MQPRVDLSKPQPKSNVDASDQDRVKSSIEKPPNPQNALPFARGNSRELEETEMAPPSRGTAPETRSREGTPEPTAEGQMAANESPAMMRLPDAPTGARRNRRLGEGGARGKLGNALRNLAAIRLSSSHSTTTAAAATAQGLIQFDSKGVDFGPWLRRFVAQVKRNWFVPQAAMIMKGHVVITFNIHRNGAITDIEVKKPSSIESFNNAAVNALMSLQSHAAAPSGIPVRVGVFYRHVPLQRGPGRLPVMRCRCRPARNSSAC